jgi:hypothetical protein
VQSVLTLAGKSRKHLLNNAFKMANVIEQPSIMKMALYNEIAPLFGTRASILGVGHRGDYGGPSLP